MKKLKIGLILFTLIIASCTSIISKNDNTPTAACRKLALERLGPDYSLDFNSDKSFILCVGKHKPTRLLPSPPFTFFLWNCQTKKVVYEKELQNGDVFWLDDGHLEIRRIPTMLSIDEKKNKLLFGYVLNIKTFKQSDLDQHIENIN